MTTTTIERDACVERVREAVAQLRRSSKGNRALRSLLHWIEDSGLGLDMSNQNAVIILLSAAWGPLPGTTRDIIHEAIGE